MKRLNEVIPDWMTGNGIFSVLQNFPVPWKSQNIETSLDLEYHGNISGDKYISPLVDKLRSGNTLTTPELTTLATAILAVCGTNWGKEWATLSAVYNPIENYSMTEQMSDNETVREYGKRTTRTDNLTHRKTGTDTTTTDETDTRTDNLTHGKTGTDTRTDNLTETITPNLTNNTANTVHGFNSSTGVPTGEQTGTQTGTNTTTHTGTQATGYNTTETDTGTQTNRHIGEDELEYNTTDADTGTQTLEDGGSDTETREYTLTRSGNIGVTTSQQMLQSERDLWMWNFFRNVVFPDIDRVLTIQIY